MQIGLTNSQNNFQFANHFQFPRKSHQPIKKDNLIVIKLFKWQ